jgi:thiol-disulfide isomerase/thioredoxin
VEAFFIEVVSCFTSVITVLGRDILAMRKKQILIAALILVLAGAIIWGVDNLTDRFPKGPRYTILDTLETEGVPDFEAIRLDGSTFRMSEIKDRVLIINFWASWCDPCVAEFPSMMKLIEHFKGEIVMIAVSADSEKNDILTFLKAFGGQRDHVEILWDPTMEVGKKFGTVRLPESFIFYSNGKLARKVVGLENWFSPDSIDFFNTVIKHTSSER